MLVTVSRRERERERERTEVKSRAAREKNGGSLPLLRCLPVQLGIHQPTEAINAASHFGHALEGSTVSVCSRVPSVFYMSQTFRRWKTTAPTGLMQHVHAEDRRTSGPALLTATRRSSRARNQISTGLKGDGGQRAEGDTCGIGAVNAGLGGSFHGCADDFTMAAM